MKIIKIRHILYFAKSWVKDAAHTKSTLRKPYWKASGYHFFLSAHCVDFQEGYPDDDKHTIIRRMSGAWNTMCVSEKRFYSEAAERHLRQMQRSRQ
ncbi:High mobility group box domain [Perkinsela sp. CCAP 1560/4]|nr:High mobility group box domain [Perkinsela sp. CCAP 1560/4]|eukprot:KNH05931.1 High mobility group box domain [Perkinsela sp. CCAP 1560/4]